MDNPNSVAVWDDKIYLVDSHYKQVEAGKEGVKGSLYWADIPQDNHLPQWNRVDDIELEVCSLCMLP